MQLKIRWSNKWIPKSFTMFKCTEWFVFNYSKLLNKCRVTLIGVCPSIWLDFLKYTQTLSCCLCSVQECAPSSGYLWFPCFPVVTKQARHHNKHFACEESNHAFFTPYLLWSYLANILRQISAWAKHASLKGGKQ